MVKSWESSLCLFFDGEAGTAFVQVIFWCNGGVPMAQYFFWALRLVA